jgi:hypothetical protein
MKRATFFKTILILVAINAAIAIFALLGGDMGETGGKILGSSLLATMGAVLALICSPAASARRAWWWPQIGMAAAGLSAALFIYAIWTEPGDGFFKVAGTVLVLAGTATIISLLSAWPGSGGLAWVGKVATVLAVIGGGMVVAAMWAEGDLPGGYWRLFGVVMVLLAAAAIATPVVHRMTAPSSPEPYTHCPFDGATVSGTVGKRTKCAQCGRSYEVVLR